MKTILSLFICGFMISGVFGQVQLDVQGNPNSDDDVANIKVNYSGVEDVVGLNISASWLFDNGGGPLYHGIGASITGGHTGLFAESGRGYSIFGVSAQAPGAFFKGGTLSPIAIELGGANYFGGSDDGVISSEMALPGSDLFLVANDAVIVEIANEAAQAGTFEVWNGPDNKQLMRVEEGGDVVVSDGTLTIANSNFDNARLSMTGNSTIASNGHLDILLDANNTLSNNDNLTIKNGTGEGLVTIYEDGNLTVDRGSIFIRTPGFSGQPAIQLRSTGDAGADILLEGVGEVIAQGDIRMQLDFDGDSNNRTFRVINGGNNDVLTVNEAGDATLPLGDLDVFGFVDAADIQCNNISICSDQRYKKSIRPLQSALSSIKKLRGVSYEWRVDEFVDKGFGNDSQIGFIAQELEQVFPDLVMTDEKGYKSIDYVSLVPVMVESIKEQQVLIDKQNVKIEVLISEMQELRKLMLEKYD